MVPQILGLRAKPNVRSCVVQAIAVTMIHLFPVIRDKAENEAMHADRNIPTPLTQDVRSSVERAAIFHRAPLVLVDDIEVIVINDGEFSLSEGDFPSHG